MALNIQEIRSQLVHDGARPSLFEIMMTNPVNGNGDLKLKYMATASQLPARNIGAIPIPYFGRVINVAGTSSYDQWTISIINDEDFLIRNAIEHWMNSINSAVGNLRQFSSSSSLLYKTNAQVRQFSKTGVPIREYTMNGLFPLSASAIQLDWAAGNEVERFSVTFAVDWWEVTGGITGNAGGT